MQAAAEQEFTKEESIVKALNIKQKNSKKKEKCVMYDDDVRKKRSLLVSFCYDDNIIMIYDKHDNY
jgi:hypothetical protein